MAAQINVINVFTWPPSVDDIATPSRSPNKASPSLPTTPERFQASAPGHALRKQARHVP